LLEHMKLIEDLHCLICHHKWYVLPMTKNASLSGCSGNFFYLATFFFHCYNWDPWRTNFVKFPILYCDYLDYIWCWICEFVMKFGAFGTRSPNVTNCVCIKVYYKSKITTSVNIEFCIEYFDYESLITNLIRRHVISNLNLFLSFGLVIL